MSDSKLQIIRAQADRLGVKYHHKAGIAKIQQAIDVHLANSEDPVEPNTVGPLEMEPIVPKTHAEQLADDRARAKAEANRLVRCIIQCMDPQKREWPGEIISVGSAKLGTFKKYVPYGSSEPYHIPKIIYDMLKEKKCSVFYNAIGEKGHKTRKSRLIDAYNIQVLPPLTKEELKSLATKQAIAQGREG